MAGSICFATVSPKSRHMPPARPARSWHSAISSTKGRIADRSSSACAQALDDLSAIRPFVDEIAECHDRAGLAGGMCRDLGETVAKQIEPAMDIRNDVGETHLARPGSSSLQPIIAALTTNAQLPAKVR